MSNPNMVAASPVTPIVDRARTAVSTARRSVLSAASSIRNLYTSVTTPSMLPHEVTNNESTEEVIDFTASFAFNFVVLDRDTNDFMDVGTITLKDVDLTPDASLDSPIASFYNSCLTGIDKVLQANQVNLDPEIYSQLMSHLIKNVCDLALYEQQDHDAHFRFHYMRCRETS